MKTVLLNTLKKGDKFIFNDIEFSVTRKFITEDKPLIAWANDGSGEHRFYHDELQVYVK